MPIPTATHVFLADDHAIFRQGVKIILAQSHNTALYVCGEAACGVGTVEAVSDLQPQVVLMDVEMPGMTGIEATTIIKKRFPSISIIALSYSDESENVLAMVGAGCDGYLLKDTSTEEMVLAINTVCRGDTYYTPRVVKHLALNAKQPAERPLTAHEKEIVQLLCDGASSKEIASTMHVSKRTVDTTRERIMEKLRVKNVIGLLRYAIKKRLVKP